jgi:hypothetical protein
MTDSFTASGSFTRTHAAHLASKVVADMYQSLAHYGTPTAADIDDFREELVELLTGGYVSEYEFGFQRNDRRVVTWHYRVNAMGDLVGGDDRAGGIYARADIAGASSFNFLTYSAAWRALTFSQRTSIKGRYNVNRVDGSAPADGDGYWTSDRNYASGGTGVARRTFRPA